MPDWKQANLASMFPPEFAAAADAANTAVGVLVPPLQVLGTALDALAIIAQGIAIPVFDVASALNAALEIFLEDLKKTGVYYLPVFDGGLDDFVRIQANFPPVPKVDDSGVATVPINLPSITRFPYHISTFGPPEDNIAGNPVNEFSQRFKRHFFDRYAESVVVVDSKNPTERVEALEVPSTGGAIDRFILRICASFDDLGDQNKPTFETKTIGVVFMIVSPTGADYVNIIRQIADVFINMKDWKLAGDRAEEIITKKGWTNPRVDPNFQYSIPPDWTSISFEKIFPWLFDGVDNILKPMADAMRTGANIADAVQFMANVISQKAEALNNQLTELQDLISSINTILSATGMYAIYIDTDKGVRDWCDQLLNSSPLPNELKELNTVDAFVGGAVFLGGSSLVLPMETFFGGFG